MTLNRLTYIITILLTGLVATGCLDDSLYDDANPAGDPDAVTFDVGVGINAVTTRSADGEKKLYEPLELIGDSGKDTLYLHTYDSEVIGETARDLQSTAAEANTRAQQVKSVDDLINYNKDFKVHAQYQEDAQKYIEWTDGKKWGDSKEIWITDRTRYWPGQKMLTFHAVSPSSEFSSLQGMSVANNSYKFSYTAKKGGTNRDAEAQKDLMFASTICNKQGSEQGRAPLKFNHALSAIKFAVRDVLNGEITNIKIKGVYGSGDCEFSVDNDGENGNFVWSNHGTKTDYSQNFNYVVSDRGQYIYPDDDSQDILLNTKMPEKTFMLIPQQIPEGATIEVTMTRTGLVSGSDAAATITVSARIDQNDLKEWLPGHEYIYTISTSKDNWVYVFEAYGNHNSNNGRHDKDITNYKNADQIYVYSPSNKNHDTYGDNAYFQVRSYRYRANDQSIKEACPWDAEHGDAKQYRAISGATQWGEYVGSAHDLTASEWITDAKELKGNGNADTRLERHDITMAAHHQMTDWPGDEWMQGNAPYSGNSKSKPWDLSTAGGSINRNTANTYVIDREGWYCFPLIYGNAIKDGNTNSAAYNGDNFVNHNNTKIDKPQIEKFEKVESADIVWSDVYNAISNVTVEKIGDERMIVFKANKGNLQQGNVVIAAHNSKGEVLWSWQIWISEHWLDPATGKSNAFKSNIDWEKAKKSGWRQRGDLLINNSHVSSSHGYYISPYNLGWCDPKNVDYLRRPGTMKFTQYVPGTDNKKKSGKAASLSILQEGEHVEYKFGNNTYYQWGRKDPMVGFVDHSNNVKRNFGNEPYQVVSGGKTLSQSILNPQMLIARDQKDQWDWCTTSYTNLWDNDGDNSTDNIMVNKTIYDPCPPGYVVPPAYCLRFIGKSNGRQNHNNGNPAYDDSDGLFDKLNNFNGEQVDDYTFKACAVNKGDQNDQNSIWLTSTGHRWFTDNYGAIAGKDYKAGDNFNASIVYLGSSTPKNGSTNAACGIALGKDESQGGKYTISSYFFGRKAMARPIRAIRELN